MIAADISRSEFRVAGVIPLALLMTLLLLYLMQRLVFTDAVPPDVVEGTPIGDIFYVEKKISTIKEEKLVKPNDPLVEPDPLPFEVTEVDPGGFDDLLPVGPPALDDGIHKGVSLSTGGALVKRVMVPPVYPSRLLKRGIEGYVDLRFDVTEYGAVQNVTVIDSNPESVFDKAAVKAVERWRYRPAMVDGVAVASKNVQERIRFQIEH